MAESCVESLLALLDRGERPARAVPAPPDHDSSQPAPAAGRA
jgi:hypothetical protein